MQNQIGSTPNTFIGGIAIGMMIRMTEIGSSTMPEMKAKKGIRISFGPPLGLAASTVIRQARTRSADRGCHMMSSNSPHQNSRFRTPG